MPPDFDRHAYERTLTRLRPKSDLEPWGHFASAWNAVAYRFRAMCDYEAAFTASVSRTPSPDVDERYRQERDLFGFFGNGFSAFESYFYALFAVGAMLEPMSFRLSTPRDQQAVSPKMTNSTYEKAFPGDSILAAFQGTLNDRAYIEWKETRNVLTHRTAPGRTIVSGEGLPTRWKLGDVPLDRHMAAGHRNQAARMLQGLLISAADFVEAKL